MENANNQTLLILKTPGFSLTSVTPFLSNRGWTIYSVDSIKDCLPLLLSTKPQFLMLSVNHQDPAVLKLGRVLARTLPICVINFSEVDNPFFIKKLEKTETLYKIFAPVTGPAIERIVNKYHKDLSHSALTEYKKIERSGMSEDSPQNDIIAIKGFRSKTSDHTKLEVSYEALQSSALLSRIESDEDELSLLSEASRLALSESCTTLEGPISPLGASSNVSCIVIESDRFSGYLIAAMGKNKRIDAEFTEKIRERLFAFLKKNGENIDDSEHSIPLKIKEIPFESWALDCAEGLVKSIHNGEEVAMAFFPFADAKTRTGSSANEDMATISLKEIPSDVFLDFNIYLYLSKNDRYVLYTPKGGILYHSQKDKLLQQNVDSLHVYKSDLNLVSALKAQSFLNEKIDNYQDRKRTSNGDL